MYDDLYDSLIEIVNFFNRLRQDEALISGVKVTLDGALFPLLMRIAHYKSLSIGELAEQVGRDHSTISRQVASLADLGFITLDALGTDRRRKVITLSTNGRKIAMKLKKAREEAMKDAVKDWSELELTNLQAVLRKLTSTLAEVSKDDNIDKNL